jgi:hypothetical protein
MTCHEKIFALHLALMTSRLLTTGPETGSPNGTRGSDGSYHSAPNTEKRSTYVTARKTAILKHVFKNQGVRGGELNLSGSGWWKWWALVQTVMDVWASLDGGGGES